MTDWFDEQQAGGALDVAALLDSSAADGLRECIAAGALVSMGLTSDGGALGVTITVDGRWRREYFRDEDLFLEWMKVAVPNVVEACKSRSASSVARKRQRGTRDR